MRMKDIDFASGVHKERSKSVRSHPAPQRKRLFVNSEEAPVVEEPNVPDALKKLWDISQHSGVFSLYDKEVYRHVSDTDTASETEEEVPLPIVLTAVYRPQHENLSMRELRNLGQEVYEHVIVADKESSYTKVERLTREQSHTPTWDLFQDGRITTSKVHAVLTRRNTTDPKNLTCRVLG